LMALRAKRHSRLTQSTIHHTHKTLR
jgi:hypothetical protein